MGRTFERAHLQPLRHFDAAASVTSAYFHYCRLDASFFTFFASFFSFGDLTATFFSVFFASWLLLMMCSVVDLTLLPEPSQFGNVGDIKMRHRALLRDSGLKRKQSENP